MDIFQKVETILIVIACITLFMNEILRRTLSYVIDVDNRLKAVQEVLAQHDGRINEALAEASKASLFQPPVAPEPDMSDIDTVLKEKGF